MKTKKALYPFVPLALAGWLGYGGVPVALGCSFHAVVPEVQLESMYPGSMGVAVSLRKAADSGVIDAATLEMRSRDTAHYNDAVQSLRALADAMARSPEAGALPENFSLGFVESSLWARYSQHDGRVDVAVHTAGPASGEAVVLTAEAVVTELLAGTLPAERALADGLILIEGDAPSKMSLRHVLVTASHTKKPIIR